MAFFARSIRHRLVIVIVTSVLAVVAVHDVAAFVELRRTALTLATERLAGVSTRLGDLLRQQARLIRQVVTTRAHDPTVVAFVRSGNRASLPDAVRAQIDGALSPMVLGASLLDRDGRTLAASGESLSADSAYVTALIAAVSGTDSVAIGPIHRVGESLVYGAIARIGERTDIAGYALEVRRLVTSADGRRQLLALIGTDAEIFVGGAGTSAWTDFAGITDAPPTSLTTDGLTSYDRPGKGPQLAAVRTIGDTPWLLVVELPEGRVFAPVREMLVRVSIITVILLTLGAAAAWVVGTRVTNPLTDLASAATAISSGEYSRRVTTANVHDEVGTLARAFNQMATSIEAAHRSLADRSRELAQRAEQLTDQAMELEMANEELAHSVEETVRARDALAIVTAELDASLASSPVGFALHDASGRYRRVNASLATLHGVPINAHIGRLPSEVSPELGAQLEQQIANVQESDLRAINIELSGKPASGSGRTQHWLASIYPIRTVDGERLGVGSVVTDLTAYKQLESQLLQAQKMEAVGRLAGGVAHDFNNILTAIEGFSQFALADLGPEVGPGPRQDIEQVLAASGRASALTRQLLAFSRQQVLQPRLLDLNQVVSGLSPMLARLIGTDVRLKTMPSPKLGAVKADPNQMEQVLVNLIVNARDAMPKGGTVVIETADVDLDQSYVESNEGLAAGPYVMLAVTDTGVGMDAATRAHIFDPFFTTKGREGTGLGLSTVYGIVKQSGGTVDVYSELGRGTSFKVYLPQCNERADRHTPTRSLPPVPSGQATILLVDDDAQVSAAAKRALERAGYVVLVAMNGRDALRTIEARAGSLDLVITDLVMPEMGGRDLARRLAESYPDVRVLYTSGYTAEAVNQQAVLEIGDAFLGKPFSPDTLVRRVHEMLLDEPSSA